jgi:hypothetical protein
MENESLHSLVREAQENLTRGVDKIGDYVEWSLYDTIQRIYAYLNSKHISGSTDSLGRDKPFFNIVSAAVNIWYRATDIDRKDIIVLPDKYANTASAFIATILLQEWMKRTKFGAFLNKWGRTLSQYGSAVVKFVEKDGELTSTVVPWQNLIVDPIDFKSLPVIERFFKTPSQLKNMATPGHPDYAGYNMEAVEGILDNREARTSMKDEQRDNRAEYIEIYEVHGELSQATYKLAKGEEPDDNDENIFFQQMHVISWVENKDGVKDFTLYSGKEKKNPYMITHLIEEDGRSLGIGAVEYLFDAQWMVNHSMKQWKDQMDLASKLIFQTADATVAGKNVLTNVENGDIIYTELNKPVTQLNNTKPDITNVKAYAEQWRVLGQEVTSTPDAARGITPPSGTALGTVQITTAQGLSLFEIMTENKGQYLEEMLREYIIPHLKTKLNNQDEIVAMLEDRDITKIDKMFVPKEAIKRYNERTKQLALSGKIDQAMPFDPQVEEGAVREQLGELGNTRYLTPGQITWKEIVKDLEWKLDMMITNEQIDKQAVYQTYNTMLQTIAQNPMVLQDPNAKLLFNKILLLGNVSPIELSTVSPAPAPVTPAAPTQPSL